VDAVYAIVAAPLLGAVLLLFGGRRIGEPVSGWVVTVLGFVSFAATLVVWATMLGRPAHARTVVKPIFDWIPVSALHVSFGLRIDPLSVFMALFVTGVSSLIFLYSIGYMHGDPSFPRFFFYLSLFLFSMLVLVLADNYLFTFLGWEGVGFCSYGLVGFWFERPKAAVAAKKAFVTNRVGDFGFMIALFLMYEHFGTFDFSTVLHGGHLSGAFATGIGLMLVLGACGKSAQIPLYMWLPDAMEGPTPISALIHAATMVTAGVYLICRSAPILHYSPTTLTVIACLGAATAFIASTIACAETDIKRILAYSTLAEIGFMFLAAGSGAYNSALFLMVTHAFFKALLFLGAGAVIHAMADEQNIRRMGGLRRYLPITYFTFVIGYLSLSAIPPFAGWWSHEAVLEAAYHKDLFLWITGVVVDGLTAYYMSREVALVFLGKARWSDTGAGADAGGHGHGTPRDAPWTMTVPLVLLAVGAALGGMLDLPFAGWGFVDHFLAPVFPASVAPAVGLATSTRVWTGVVGTAVNFVGLFVGLRLWRVRVKSRALEPAFLVHGWYIDDGIAAAVAGPLAEGAGDLAYRVDLGFVDRTVTGVGGLITAGGRQLRRVQTGYLRTYALGIGLGAAAILIYASTRIGS
jgi:NADH-quinone oxidoreductase subunit L